MTHPLRMLSSFTTSASRIFAAELARSDRRTRPRGHVVEGTLENSQGFSRYKLFIPAAYVGQPLPMVVMLHGCGQNAIDFANGTAMNACADRSDCLVLYPEQSALNSWSGCWHWFDKAHQQRGRGEPATIASVTRQVMDEYAVKSDQIFVAGMSAGGAMAIVMGHTYPDLYAAVGSHSGLPRGCARSSTGAWYAMRFGAMTGRAMAGRYVSGQPTIVFHGDRDKTVHCSNSDVMIQDVLVGEHAGAIVSTPPRIDAGTHAGKSYTRTRYADSRGATVAEHWVIHGGGHAWSGGRADGSYTDLAGPGASQEMLRFFLQQGNPARPTPDHNRSEE